MTARGATNPRRLRPGLRDRIVTRVLYEEDHCHLCGGWVDTTMRAHQPGSPEVDEIIPVSKGGSPVDRDNCRLAHRACNRDRSNEDLDTYLARRNGTARPLRTETTTSPRRWWT